MKKEKLLLFFVPITVLMILLAILYGEKEILNVNDLKGKNFEAFSNKYQEFILPNKYFSLYEENNNQFNKKLLKDQIPDCIDENNWDQIINTIESNFHRINLNTNKSFSGSNKVNSLELKFTQNGHTFINSFKDSVLNIDFKLLQYGYSNLISLNDPKNVFSEQIENGSKLTYDYGDNLKEWWENTSAGLEQWFSIQDPPLNKEQNTPLKLVLGVETNMIIEIAPKKVNFKNKFGEFNYEKFKAWDSNGEELCVWFESTDNNKEIALIIDDKNAKYPILVDPTIINVDYIKASNTNSSDHFGYSVAIDGNTMVIGTPYEQSSATGVNGNQLDNSLSIAGAVYVFVKNSGNWVQQAYLKASNTNSADRFGECVAISGETIVVGAMGERSNATGINGNQLDNSFVNCGAAYVFVRNGGINGTWNQQAYLKASNSNANDFFGCSVAISGETIVIGAEQEGSMSTGINGDQLNNSYINSGAAYVFTRIGGLLGSWNQQAYLKASNTNSNDNFGNDVSISGETIIVAAENESSMATGVNGNQIDNSASSSGAIYVFIRNGGLLGTWVQQAYIKASNTDESDNFGCSLDIDGEVIVVGAEDEDSNSYQINGDQSNNSNLSAGAAYVFYRIGGLNGTWNQVAYLKTPNNGSGDRFGSDVAISSNIIIVGAISEDSNAIGVNGNGADNSMGSSGAVYTFENVSGNWQSTYIKSFNTNTADLFGCSLDVSGTIILVGAELEDSNATGVNGNQLDNSFSSAGAAYTYEYTSELSVTLGYSEILCNNDCNKIIWSVNSQNNLESFLIFGSGEDQEYSLLQTINSNSQTINNYESQFFCDNQIKYYRLLAIDNNGEIKMEKVFNNDCINDNGIELYPNPVSTILSISIKQKFKDEYVYIFSIDGKLVFSLLPNNEVLQINVTNFQNGVYYIQNGDDKNKFVKVNY